MKTEKKIRIMRSQLCATKCLMDELDSPPDSAMAEIVMNILDWVLEDEE